MARPPKNPATRKDKDLRIPVTGRQRELVSQGAAAAGLDMATWARPILLEAAKREVAKRSRESLQGD